MCLFVDSNKVWVAKKDIVCYKVMVEYSGDKSKYSWVSPYKSMNYEKGHTYILGKQLELLHSFNKEYPYRVEEGFHSFANLSDVLLFLNAYEVMHPWRLMGIGRYAVIVKCIIPKETAYVEGLYFAWGNEFPSFCSESIICGCKIKNK